MYRSYHHGQLTFSMMYAYSENYVLPISHDEVVYGKGSLLRKMPGDRWQQLANLRAYLAYMWAHPGKQLLFMGSEFAQDAEWAESRSLDWWHLDDPAHRGVLQLVTDLNTRYKELDALWSQDVDPAGFQWIDANDASGNVLSFLRYGKPGAGGADGRRRRRRAASRWPASSTSPARRTTSTGSACRAAATGARCSTPTPRATAARASATSAASRPCRSRGTGSRSRRPWPRLRWVPSGSCTRAEPRRAALESRPPGADPAGDRWARALADLEGCLRPAPRRRPARGRACMRPCAALPSPVVGLLLTGCATVVIGRPSPVQPSRRRAAGDFPISGRRATSRSTSSPATPWPTSTPSGRTAYPDVFGGPFRPLSGGYFSRRLRATSTRARTPRRGSVRRLARRRGTTVLPARLLRPALRPIAYDRARCCRSWPTDYGRFLGRVVMAHEFGHAMQGRFGFAAPGAASSDETQADCFAGAWTRWVADGNAEHSSIRTPELDEVVRGLPAAARPGRQRPRRQPAHGSYFDRVSAFYEGFDGGVARLPRRLRARPALHRSGVHHRQRPRQPGQRPLRRHRGPGSASTLPRFWTTAFQRRLRQGRSPAPRSGVSTATRPAARRGRRTASWATAPPTTPVYYDETELTGRPTTNIGDFAVADGRVHALRRWPRGTSGAVRRRRRRHPVGRLPDRLVHRRVVQRRVHGLRCHAEPRRRRRGVSVPAHLRRRPARCFPDVST